MTLTHRKPLAADSAPEMRSLEPELLLFERARTWKSYWSRQIRPHVSGRVLEVGAGLAHSIPFLWSDRIRDWLCLEPDTALYRGLTGRMARREVPAEVRAIEGSLAALAPSDRFDTILYLDVLEHIEDDAAELAAVAAHLAPNGHLVVLAPAHNALYTPFDRHVGHFRRYDRTMLRSRMPASLHPVAVRYLDCAGLLISLANRVIGGASQPTPLVITLWDRLFVPVSRLFDGLLGYRVGKSILGIWRKTAA